MNLKITPTRSPAPRAFASPCAKAHHGVPFHSSVVAQLLDPPVPGGSAQAVDTGRGSHLGNFTSVYDLEVSLEAGLLIFDGTFTSTVSNGDTITFDIHVVISLTTWVFEGQFTAIGGTGRFQGISGGLVTTSGVVDPSSGLFQYDSEGYLPSIGATKHGSQLRK